MAEFLLIPFGTAGDTFPFIGLGKRLKQRGHSVRVMSNGYFSKTIRDAGLVCDEYGSREDYLATLENPDIWHPIRGFRAVVGHPLMAQMVEEQHHFIIEQFTRNPKLVVVAGTLAFGARIARETHGLKLATVHMAPSVFLSVEKPPRLPGMNIPAWWPRSWVRGMYWMANQTIMAPVMKRVVGDYRRELVLPKVKYYIRDWIHSQDLVLGLFPHWYAAPAGDWPGSVRLTDFPFYDTHETAPLPVEVEDFLQSGPPPLIVTFGSAMRVGKKLFRAAADACIKLKCRAILLTPFAEQVPDPLPEHLRRFDFLPLSQVLPRAAAIIHHGGIGTMAQAMRWGVPQVITPLAHDQFDNAARGESLGISVTIPGAQLTGGRLAKKLKKIFDQRMLHRNAHAVSQRFIGVDAFQMICDELEHFAKRSPSTRYRS